jgi:hypothetical protein
MRSTLPFLVAFFVSIVGCRGDLTTPVSKKSPEPAKTLFAVGSAEQNLVNQFLSHFPAEQARKIEDDFRTRRTTFVAQNPVWQKELDGIYAALDRRPLSFRSPALLPVESQHKPGPVEAALIEDFIASVPTEQAAKLREVLLNETTQLGSSNPAMMKKLRKIYEARRQAMEAEAERNMRQ